MTVLGQKYLFAVAQRSFETGGNTFSTLIPLADSNGLKVDADQDFPHRGLAWWMVRGTRDVVDAPPGKLLVAAIEVANQKREEVYQVLQPSLPRTDEFIEIIDVPNTIVRPETILGGVAVVMDHEPGKFVIVRAGNVLYGPLIATVDPDDTSQTVVRFEKSVTNEIYQMPDAVGETGYLKLTTNVCPYAAAPSLAETIRPIRYTLITGQLFAQLKERGVVVELMTDAEIVRSVAKPLMGRKALRDFANQFESMIDSATAPPKVLERAQELLARTNAAANDMDAIVDTILQSETLRPRIDCAVKDRVEREIENRSATIDAQAHERIQKLTTDLAQLEDAFKKKEESQRRDFEQRELEHRKRLDEETRVEAARLEKARADLKAQQQTIEDVLFETIDELNSGRNSLLNNFLAIQPIIERVSRRADPAIEGHRSDDAALAKNSFSIPALSTPATEFPDLDEAEFFERFCSHAANCGFVFENHDLLAYHLSVKGDSPIILGGASGTGKSSLPRLYAEAAAGDRCEANFLPIDVNPSWTSPADLFGYSDPLERRFMPGQSGLFRELAIATRELEQGSLARPRFICFDEMNLAQPEHYMSDLIQAMSRDLGKRVVRVFDPGAVREDDGARPFHTLSYDENIRTIGTVNFDETTRPLSLRLLDRVNMLEIQVSDTLPSIVARQQTGVAVPGAPVQVKEFRRWTRPSAASPRLIEVFEKLQPHLNALGAPLTPRRQAAINRFVVTAPASLCTVDEAIDIQLVQRVIPQLRNLFRPDALDRARRLAREIETLRNLPRTKRRIEFLIAREELFESELASELQ
jgi:Skp family chaperone for outer membrane proteins